MPIFDQQLEAALSKLLEDNPTISSEYAIVFRTLQRLRTLRTELISSVCGDRAAAYEEAAIVAAAGKRASERMGLHFARAKGASEEEALERCEAAHRLSQQAKEEVRDLWQRR